MGMRKLIAPDEIHNVQIITIFKIVFDRIINNLHFMVSFIDAIVLNSQINIAVS